MIDVSKLDIGKLAQEAEAQAEKEVRTKLIGWLKGMAADIYNLQVKADKLRAEADSLEARMVEKKAQYSRVLSGDLAGVQLPELSLSVDKA